MLVAEDPCADQFADHFPGPEIIEIDVSCADGVAVVTVVGEMDVSNSSWLHECLNDVIDAGIDEVVLDIEGLTYMDSTGLSVVVGANRRMRAAGGAIEIVAPTPNVARLFAVSGLTPVLTIRTAVGEVEGDRPNSDPG
ncbi:MAG TPA: STAS domain-containing protein [Acidimicrobiales bacterium]|jgi:anti-sigma B factor antagonist